MDAFLVRMRASTLVRWAALAAVAWSAVAILLDGSSGFLPSRSHSLVSSVPLIAIALAYLALQATTRPAPRLLLERALLCMAFILWAMSQLAAGSRLGVIANDVAILLFVFDLGLIIRDETKAVADPPRAGAPISDIEASPPCRCCCCSSASA